MDRVDVEEKVVVESIKPLDSIYKNCIETCNVDLQVFRISMVEDKMPEEECFDAVIDILKNEPASTPVVFSCQMGKEEPVLASPSPFLSRSYNSLPSSDSWK